MAKLDLSRQKAVYNLYLTVNIICSTEEICRFLFTEWPIPLKGCYINIQCMYCITFQNFVIFTISKHIWPQGIWIRDCGLIQTLLQRASVAECVCQRWSQQYFPPPCSSRTFFNSPFFEYGWDCESHINQKKTWKWHYTASDLLVQTHTFGTISHHAMRKPHGVATDGCSDQQSQWRPQPTVSINHQTWERTTL